MHYRRVRDDGAGVLRTLESLDDALPMEKQEAGGAAVEVELDPFDSSDEDYQPIPVYTPRPHDTEAGSSRTDPVVLALLDKLT